MDIQTDLVGNTRLIKVDGIYFKCEYENPTGSVKDRSIKEQLIHVKSIGQTHAVISSSGNAAISAAFFCQRLDIGLTVFISPHTNKGKWKILKQFPCEIIVSDKAVSDAQKFSLTHKAYNLRQSKDENAVSGYEEIAHELYTQQKDIDAVFVPVSSGTTLVGIARGFEKLNVLPAIHAVQTQSVHPVAVYFDSEYETQTRSIADGIVARVIPRRDEIIGYIKKSKGSGWIMSDEEMMVYHKKLQQNGMVCSYEGAAAYAAVEKAKKKGFMYKNPVCILTGKYYE